jgi:transcription initiation factor TFIID subunit 12
MSTISAQSAALITTAINVSSAPTNGPTQATIQVNNTPQNPGQRSIVMATSGPADNSLPVSVSAATSLPNLTQINSNMVNSIKPKVPGDGNLTQKMGPAPPVVVLNKARLQELVTEIDPSEQLDEDVEDYLLEMTDDFIERLVTNSCQVAKHRGSHALEVKDVQLILEKYYNMTVPGFGPQLNVLNRLKSHSNSTEAHKQRVALIKRTLKKF